MFKKFYLMPVMALSLATFTLAACDDQSEQQAPPPEAAESTMPGLGTALSENAELNEAAEATVHVSNARAYATAQSAANGAVFATLQNPQDQADMLLGVQTDVADSAELHQTYMDPQTSTMLMRKTSGIDIAAGQTLELEPSGFHIMLVGLRQPLVEGESFNITLTFREAGDVIVPVTVTAPGAAAATDTMDHSGHDDGMTMEEPASPTEPSIDSDATTLPETEGTEDAIGSEGSAALDDETTDSMTDEEPVTSDDATVTE